MSIIACAPRAARYSAAGMTRSIASSYPAALNDRRAMPRAMNVIPGYMSTDSAGILSTASGTTKPITLAPILRARRRLRFERSDGRSHAAFGNSVDLDLGLVDDLGPLGDFDQDTGAEWVGIAGHRAKAERRQHGANVRCCDRLFDLGVQTSDDWIGCGVPAGATIPDTVSPSSPAMPV